MPHKELEARRTYNRKYREKNRDHIRSRQRKWAEENIERKRSSSRLYVRKNRDAMRDAKLGYRYGITTSEYEEMLRAQENRCLTCSRTFSDKVKPNIDHDHTTGAVRGVLCHNCNVALGCVRDDPIVLERLASYLKEHDQGVFA